MHQLLQNQSDLAEQHLIFVNYNKKLRDVTNYFFLKNNSKLLLKRFIIEWITHKTKWNVNIFQFWRTHKKSVWKTIAIETPTTGTTTWTITQWWFNKQSSTDELNSFFLNEKMTEDIWRVMKLMGAINLIQEGKIGSVKSLKLYFKSLRWFC